jgi:excisionase family DNA binding protein
MEQRALFTIKEAAQYAKVGVRSIYLAIGNGELRYVHMGTRKRRIRLVDMEKWIASKTVKEIKRC